MSKAFTRESDSEEPSLTRVPQSLPPGVKNYMTPDGTEELRAELKRLVEGGKQSTHGALIAYLTHSLQTAVIVEPVADGVVRFGCTVKVQDKTGEELQYRIVGVDQMDLDRNWISWRSPLAKALVNAKVGQKVKFKIPAGEEELEILAID